MSSENVTFARHNSHLKLKVMKNMSSFTFTNKVEIEAEIFGVISQAKEL